MLKSIKGYSSALLPFLTEKMKSLYYTASISATPEKVHQIMLNRDTYRQWTLPFSPTSDIEGNWSEDSKMYFISTDDKGNKMGIISTIDKNIPGEVVAIRHIGVFSNERESYSGTAVVPWKNAYEIYRFKVQDGGTQITCTVEIDSDDYEKHFDTQWPQALQILKELCEKS